MDGKILTASKVFAVENVPTFMKAEITCRPATSDLRMVIESYQSTSETDMLPASPFVVDGEGYPEGRIRTAADAEPSPVGLVFRTAEYGNVAEWHMGFSALAMFAAEDNEAFQNWIVDVSGDGAVELSAFAAVINAPGDPTYSLRAMYQTVQQNRRVAELEPGRRIRGQLPIAIELKNEGGAFEIVVPDDDDAVNEVLTACHGRALVTSQGVAQASTETDHDSVLPASEAATDQALWVTDVELGRSIAANWRIADEAATDDFTASDTIYVSVTTEGFASESRLTARWTYQDGQVVAESSETLPASGPATTAFHIIKPDGFPAGNYRVEIQLNGQTVGTKDFEVR